MSKIIKFLWFLLIVLLIVVGAVFSLLNSMPVTLDLFFAETPPINLSLIVFAAFAIGLVVGMTLTSLTVMKVKVGAHRKQKKMVRAMAAEAN